MSGPLTFSSSSSSRSHNGAIVSVSPFSDQKCLCFQIMYSVKLDSAWCTSIGIKNLKPKVYYQYPIDSFPGIIAFTDIDT